MFVTWQLSTPEDGFGTPSSNNTVKMHQPLILAVDDDEDNLELLTDSYPLNCHIIIRKRWRSHD
ncbi:hypothetical protein [Chroococcidiopsis cubana]|uniref:hypothetical protein n=1 Tax=Chroococcidiopsis cubana TaxID=171392 RepID=UPI002ACD4E3A|nr:hypothetical protein [Chroococcidiopsis cubana]